MTGQGIRSDSNEEVDCPFCAEKIKVRAIVCKHCGRDLNSAQSIAQARTKAVPHLTNGPGDSRAKIAEPHGKNDGEGASEASAKSQNALADSPTGRESKGAKRWPYVLMAIALLVAANFFLSKWPSEMPAVVEGAKESKAGVRVASTAKADSAQQDLERKNECFSEPQLVLFRRLGSWSGPFPATASLDARSAGEIERFAGLDSALRNGQLTVVENIYVRDSGAWGTIYAATGQYKGTTYSGTFYCNNSQYRKHLPSQSAART